MSKIRSILILGVALLLVADASAGFMPKRSRTRRPRNSGGGVIMQRGPRYEKAPEGRMSSGEVQAAIQASHNGINDIAAQSAGLGGGGACGHSATDRLNAITAQLQVILAKVQQDYANQKACSGSISAIAACQLYWANQAVADASKAVPLSSEANSLVGQAQAEASCQARGGGGFGAPVNPPGVSYQNLANRFGVSLRGDTGGYGHGFNSSIGGFGSGAWGFRSAALDALQDDVDNGRIPDYDGSRRRGARTLADFQRAADAAAAVGAKVQAGKAFAGKPATDFSDPDAAARQEYLRINYDVLGDKYAALAKGRSEKADAVAVQALASRPEMPLVSADPPAIKVEGGDDDEGLFGKVKDEFKDQIEDRLTDGLDKRSKALIGIYKVEDSVFSGLDKLSKALPDALAELGSASLSHASVDAYLSKQDKVFGETAKVSQEQASEIAGYNPNPEANVKKGLRDWLRQRLEGGGE